MSIKKEYLGRIAENILKTLDNENVTAISDLDRIMNRTFLIDENTKEKISVELRPSNLNTTVRVISYIAPERGIPLELRVNEELKYSQIVLKGNFNLSGYEAFHQDMFGNIAQNKKLDSTNISQIKSELKELI